MKMKVTTKISIPYQKGFQAGQLAERERCLKMIKELAQYYVPHSFHKGKIEPEVELVREFIRDLIKLTQKVTEGKE